MGYTYEGWGGRARLCCDNCGVAGGVRKRTCPHKVRISGHKTIPPGTRHAIPCCPAPALCSACFKKYGGTRKLHEKCAESAAATQASYDAERALLDRGEYLHAASWGDWDSNVPAGMVGAVFTNLGGEERYALLTRAQYERLMQNREDGRIAAALSGLGETKPWDGPGGYRPAEEGS